MHVIHVSAEGYPMAKVGGLADVAGALPKYQQRLGIKSALVLPMHRTDFLLQQSWDLEHKSAIMLGGNGHDYTIIKIASADLAFELFCVDIQGLLDRERVYGYEDDSYRFLAFQLAVVDWMKSISKLPDLLHVHDHHSALIPFFLKHVHGNEMLNQIRTVLTIHNAQYQGWMDPTYLHFFPRWDDWKTGLLFWDGQINPLACGIKCADWVTTVSKGYLRELHDQAHGLSALIRQEYSKCSGIVNGIDHGFWNPETDPLIPTHFSLLDVDEGKDANKLAICREWGLNPDLPLIVFIGRLVDDKGADLLPASISRFLETYPESASFFVLGNGQYNIEKALEQLNSAWVGYYNSQILYNETLSHQLYAAADFLLMPSRVEPCGLNQLYALRYGTMPMIRRTGGLADTVVDCGDQDGFGLCFDKPTVADIHHTLHRALHLFKDKKALHRFRQQMMTINHSWESSCEEYIDLYRQIILQTHQLS
jgi:starch synthase